MLGAFKKPGLRVQPRPICKAQEEKVNSSMIQALPVNSWIVAALFLNALRLCKAVVARALGRTQALALQTLTRMNSSQGSQCGPGLPVDARRC